MADMNDQPTFPDDPVYSRKVLEMLTVANEYCLFLEKAEEYSKTDVYQFLQKILPLIYLKVSLLPDIKVKDEDATEHYVTEEQWESMFNMLRNKFNADDSFSYIDHHEKSQSEGIPGSMAENVTDIYQDLKDFVLLYQKPLKSFKENAVRDCKHLFETHFGFRLVTLHTALHYLLFLEEEDMDNF
jgi:hypothetical protein